VMSPPTAVVELGSLVGETFAISGVGEAGDVLPDDEPPSPEGGGGSACDCKPRSPSSCAVGVGSASKLPLAAAVGPAGVGAVSLLVVSVFAEAGASEPANVSDDAAPHVYVESVTSPAVAAVPVASVAAPVPSVVLADVPSAFGATAVPSPVHAVFGESVAESVPSLVPPVVASVPVADVWVETLETFVVSLAVAEMAVSVSEGSVVVAGISTSDSTSVAVVLSGTSAKAMSATIECSDDCALGAGGDGRSSALAVEMKADVKAKPATRTTAQPTSRSRRRRPQRVRRIARAAVRPSFISSALAITAFTSEAPEYRI
jgi:hypothetical protein